MWWVRTMLAFSLSGIAAAGGGVRFDSALDAGWLFEETDGACLLRQNLPGYGAARFMSRPDGELRFELTAHRDLVRDSAVRVERVTPAWHDGYPQRQPLAEAVRHPGGTLSLSGEAAGRALLGLYNGFVLAFITPPADDEATRTASSGLEVRLSPVHIRVPHDHFVQCQQGLLARAWVEMERTRVGYGLGEWALPGRHLSRIEELAAYVLADDSVVRVYVDGHADASGSPTTNRRLSQQRAEAVARALQAEGVPPARLVVRYHGDRYPVASNETDEGRAKNRRTTVRLVRTWDEPDRVATR